MPYSVTNLDTNESHGTFDTFIEATGCVTFDRLTSYLIEPTTQQQRTTPDKQQLRLAQLHDANHHE